MSLDSLERRRLERLLAAHRPADPAERESLERIQEFVARVADPFDRGAPGGHLTGSAFVLCPRAQLLLVHHRGLGSWVQLGGHAEGERAAMAVALREAREESGLGDLRPHPGWVDEAGDARLLDVDVHSVPAMGDESAHAHYDLRFALITAVPQEIVAERGGRGALEWVALDEALRRGDAGMRRAVHKLLSGARSARAPRG